MLLKTSPLIICLTLSRKSEFAEHVKRITNQIQAATDIDQILLDLHKDILGLFDAEDLTLFAFDTEKKEIFSKVPISIRSRKSVSRSPSKAWPAFAPNIYGP